jgi:RNA polymerase sigma-70 factor (ECF subfamily)
MARTLGPGWLEEPVSATTLGERAGDDRWAAVFAALADGRLEALEELYDLAAAEIYRLALWRTGSLEDAEDVVQEVFVRLAERGPELRAVRHPRRWLLTVTRRCAVDLCRRRQRRRTEPMPEAPYLEPTTGDAERAAEARAISRLVGRLPANQREVVLLRHFAGCTYSEIGRITRVPTFTAASRYRLAIARLRRLMED